MIGFWHSSWPSHLIQDFVPPKSHHLQGEYIGARTSFKSGLTGRVPNLHLGSTCPQNSAPNFGCDFQSLLSWKQARPEWIQSVWFDNNQKNWKTSIFLTSLGGFVADLFTVLIRPFRLMDSCFKRLNQPAATLENKFQICGDLSNATNAMTCCGSCPSPRSPYTSQLQFDICADRSQGIASNQAPKWSQGTFFT